MKSRRSAAKKADPVVPEEIPVPVKDPTPSPVSSRSSRKIKKKTFPDSYTDMDVHMAMEEEQTVLKSVPLPSTPLPDTPAGPSPKPISSQNSNSTTKSSSTNKDANKKKKSKTNKDSSSSSDEERWLEKIKDPKLMTARQRAMYDRENGEKDFMVPETLMSLPTGYKEKVLTAEAIERAQVKSAKRKQLADEKREKDKRKTMDRLLKKQESKLCKVNKSKNVRSVPIITYKSTKDGCILNFPPDYDLKLGRITTETVAVPPLTVSDLATGGGAESNPTTRDTLCAICKKENKRYNCSKTNTPLCSFKCYQENVKQMKSVIV